MKHAIYVIVNGQLKLLSTYNDKEIAESLYKKYSRNGTFEVILAMYNENIPVVTTEDLYTLGIKKIAGDLEQASEQLKQEVEELKWHCEGLQLENYQKKTDLFVVNVKYDDLKEKYNVLEAENASLKSEIIDLKNKIMDLKNKPMDLNQYLSIEKLETKNKKKFWQL